MIETDLAGLLSSIPSMLCASGMRQSIRKPLSSAATMIVLLMSKIIRSPFYDPVRVYIQINQRRILFRADIDCLL